ncbi:MAG TPA: lytic transglycosylase domain-containing protein [Casimicrobiaceae bacterium]|nr:lytic transglycosylase domain-containing protein [Casimicrobiaceae bacterium]
MIRRTDLLVTSAFAALLALVPAPVRAGAQAEEALAPSVVTVLSRAISDRPVPPDWAARPDAKAWIDDMSKRLASRVPDEDERRELLRSVHYESVRAGLDPQLVLGVIHHESGFKKYAVSVADARGYMQVMPFWTRLIGSADHNLFHLRTNLRYGCVILRHYIDREGGDLYRALGRYNGSLGRSEYPGAVLAAMQRYATAAMPVTLGASVAIAPLR